MSRTSKKSGTKAASVITAATIRKMSKAEKSAILAALGEGTRKPAISVGKNKKKATIEANAKAAGFHLDVLKAVFGAVGLDLGNRLYSPQELKHMVYFCGDVRMYNRKHGKSLSVKAHTNKRFTLVGVRTNKGPMFAPSFRKHVAAVLANASGGAPKKAKRVTNPSRAKARNAS